MFNVERGSIALSYVPISRGNIKKVSGSWYIVLLEVYAGDSKLLVVVVRVQHSIAI